ncbi:MAG: ParB/RepB/Spo0J family partition protein [Spirochaetales bacterium]
MSKRALGKGIDALFQSVVEEGTETPPSEGYEVLEITRLVPNPHQPRKEFNPEALEELAASIRSRGVLQPILVEPREDGTYLIVAGERRYRAALLAGLPKVPVIVRTFTDQERLEIALIENLQREDLTPIEEAKAYRSLMEAAGLSQEELAERIGKNRSTIANTLRLLKLPEDMQEAIHSGSISPGHARAILAVVNPADMRILFNRIVEKGLSVREAEAMATELNKGVRASEPEKDTPFPKQRPIELQEMEQRLLNVLGTKVRIRGNGRRGTIEIAYFSTDDLERILELFEK